MPGFNVSSFWVSESQIDKEKREEKMNSKLSGLVWVREREIDRENVAEEKRA